MSLSRAIKRLRRKEEKVTARKQRRKPLIEPLEPRVLLSADSLITGLTAAMQNGLVSTEDALLGVISTDSNFDTPIAAVLQTTHDVNGDNQNDGLPNGKVDDKDVHVPDVRDVLSLNVNRDGSADSNGFETISSLDPIFGSLTSPVNTSDIADVYRYVAGEKEAIFFGVPFLYTPTAEQALSAMDLNSGSTADNIVGWQEMYKVLVVGAISDFLAACRTCRPIHDGARLSEL